MYNKYSSKGLVVLGFPCNQVGVVFGCWQGKAKRMGTPRMHALLGPEAWCPTGRWHRVVILQNVFVVF